MTSQEAKQYSPLALAFMGDAVFEQLCRERLILTANMPAKKLHELAEAGAANLTLMGIEPTYPSEKYGYIIPENGNGVSKVKEFKEKPDTETAKKYLSQNALWNAGIFAFFCFRNIVFHF